MNFKTKKKLDYLMEKFFIRFMFNVKIKSYISSIDKYHCIMYINENGSYGMEYNKDLDVLYCNNVSEMFVKIFNITPVKSKFFIRRMMKKHYLLNNIEYIL